MNSNCNTTVKRSIMAKYGAIPTDSGLLLAPQAPTGRTVSAAEKVFGIPELLAEILIHVSTMTRSTFRTRMYPPKDQTRPAVRLYVLQRVNTTFQATILGNKTMRRRMFLESCPKRFADQTLHWLMAEIGISTGGTSLEMVIATGGNSEVGPSSELSATTYIYSGNQCYRPRCKLPEASWRRIRLLRDEDGSGLHLEFFCVSTVRLRSFCFEDNMTLGQIHDGLQRLIPHMVDYRDAYFGYGATGGIDARCTGTYYSRDGRARQHLLGIEKRLRVESDRDDVWEL